MDAQRGRTEGCGGDSYPVAHCKRSEIMIEDQIHPALRNSDIRKDLIEYYKWIVNLATFITTVSLSLVALFPKGVRFSWLLILGWVLLAVCIFLNWLLVKRLVSIPIVTSVSEEEMGIYHALFMATLGNMTVYGSFQNATFLLGALAIALGFALNLIFGTQV
jgi:hypothetical protein